jgi:hypothetical protein
MKGKFPLLSVLVLVFGSLGASAVAQDCSNGVCIDYSDVGGYYLLTVTDVDDGSPLEVEMTDIPSSIPPGGGDTPPTEPYSFPDSEKSTPGLQNTTSTDVITQEFPGVEGTWIVNITVTYNANGEVIDVDANVIFIPNENEQK